MVIHSFDVYLKSQTSGPS